MFATVISTVINTVLKVAQLTIKIPLWVIVATLVGGAIAKHTAVSNAIDNLTQQNKLAAAQAETEAMRVLMGEITSHLDKVEDANTALTRERDKARKAKVDADATIREMLAHSAPADCAVDADLLGRLRSIPRGGDANPAGD